MIHQFSQSSNNWWYMALDFWWAMDVHLHSDGVLPDPPRLKENLDWYFRLPSGKLTQLLNMAIYSWFTHLKMWFSIVMLVYKRVSSLSNLNSNHLNLVVSEARWCSWYLFFRSFKIALTYPWNTLLWSSHICQTWVEKCIQFVWATHAMDSRKEWNWFITNPKHKFGLQYPIINYLWLTQIITDVRMTLS